MGIPILILGDSGSGKSTSMRNFSVDEVGIFNVASKPLPFRKKLNKIDNATYNTISKALSQPKLKRYVIDDSQYLMAFEMFDKAKETGYGKFTDMALHFKGLIDLVIKQTPADVIVYFLHHTQKTELGIKAKTVGKMLDDQLTIEGLFSIVLRTKVENGKYVFITQTDGNDTVKSPMDMFSLEIDNDLKLVDETIREYWSLDGTNLAVSTTIEESQTIDKIKIDTIKSMIKKTKTEEKALCTHYKIEKVEDMTVELFMAAMKMLEKKEKEMAKKKSQHSDEEDLGI